MIAIGSDHGGIELKEQMIEHLKKEELSVRMQDVIQKSHVIIRYMPRKLPMKFFLENASRVFLYVEQELE